MSFYAPRALSLFLIAERQIPVLVLVPGIRRKGSLLERERKDSHSLLSMQSLCLVLRRAFYVLGSSGFSRLIQISIAHPASTNLGCPRLLINSICMRIQLGLLQNLADNPGVALLHGRTAPYVKEVEEVESGLLRLKLAKGQFLRSMPTFTMCANQASMCFHHCPSMSELEKVH
ncbi:hypothetical protein CDL15_Pgr021140 [Punica granatum]|uniref:Uncharacterized protein n=1 Tax=Punica granatum TaxID=22663 RepID=A0A218WJ15_PUNGR|nr:hypothetical protein CDL15_Pgr021140 [Punica granatum]